MKTWAILLALACLLVSGWISQTFLFKQVIQQETHHTSEIPTQLGAWNSIDEIPPSPSEIRGLETQDMIRRIYSNGQRPVELVVAYIAHSSRKSAHAQEACLRGSGAQVGQILSVHLDQPKLDGKLIQLQFRERRQWVLYFYKIGSTYTADYLRSSWLMFFGGLTQNQKPQGASLVRYLTPAREGETADQVLQEFQGFSQSVLPELEKRLP